MNVTEFITSRQFLLPAAFIVGGFVLGLILERFVLLLIRRIFQRSGRAGYRTVKNGLRGMIALWLTIVGLYIATRFISMSPYVQSIYERALVVLILFTVTLAVMRITAGLVDLYIRRAEGALPSSTIIGNILRIGILLTGVLVILTYLDVPVTPLITALGIGGFAIALAFQDTLSNLFSGLHILASRLVRPGDFIKLDTGEEGYVVDVTWRNTSIRTLPNNMVIVPNSRLASAVITNYYQPVREMSVLMEVGVAYTSDLDKVERVTTDVAREVLESVPGGLSNPEPFIRFHTFSEYRIDFTVIMRAAEFVDQYLLKHEFVKKLTRRYEEEGIEIPLPVHTVHMERERAESTLGY
ncbi:MAG: mechanosensitive ion channel family protein [Actinobacteria bacterium]|nr:mechanosensitive ion channel family protein [Actinomycetota bacterium]